jgi:hypothetical protein
MRYIIAIIAVVFLQSFSVQEDRVGRYVVVTTSNSISIQERYAIDAPAETKLYVAMGGNGCMYWLADTVVIDGVTNVYANGAHGALNGTGGITETALFTQIAQKIGVTIK